MRHNYVLTAVLVLSILGAVCYFQYPHVQTLQNQTSRWFQSAASSRHKLRIAFYTVGLGKGYFNLSLELLNSAVANLCVNDFIQVDYFIFSNQPVPSTFPSNFHVIPTVKRGWPFDSQDRMKWIYNHSSANPEYDYIMWMDADQRFERPICFDLLGELVAVSHPHYYHQGHPVPFPYEDRPESKAYIPAENGLLQNYYSAHYFGGTRNKILVAMKTMDEWMEDDLARGIQAKVDDESYLNAYFYHNFPTVVLSRIFVWPEGYENEYFHEVLERHGGRQEAVALARLMEYKPRNDD